MMRTVLVGLACLAAASAVAVQPPPTATATETAHLRVLTATSATRVAPGARLSLYVDVTPKPTMHVYAPGQKDVIPVLLQLDAGPFKARAPRFPPAEKYFFQPLNETQLVYSKPFRVVQDITIAPNASGGTGLTVSGTLKYQACDDSICYMPVEVPVGWSLVINRISRKSTADPESDLRLSTFD